MQVVVIQGDALFKSAQSDVNTAYEPLINRIARVMNELPGNIVVRGYTDSIPISTPRFPSNQALSKARAENVARMMRKRIVTIQVPLSDSGLGA